MPEPSDRRAAPRYCVNQLIRVSALQEEYLWASARDISVTGFSAMSSSPLDPLTPIFALLELEDAEGPGQPASIQVEGFVAWSRQGDQGWEFGTTFSRIRQKDRNLLTRWLEAHGPDATAKGGCIDA